MIGHVFKTKQRIVAFDHSVQTANIEQMKKYLHRLNIVVGFFLALITGIFGIVASLPTLNFSGALISLYCTFFGVGIILFEMTSSRKVHQYFRENYGFIMTYRGRVAFLVLVGFFSMGGGGTGVFTGVVAIFDALFHIYIMKRNPNMLTFIAQDDAARLDGGQYDSEAEASAGFLQRMANQAVEDPRHARQQMGQTWQQAQQINALVEKNPELVQHAQQYGKGQGVPPPMKNASVDDEFDPRSSRTETNGLLGGP